MIGPRDRLPAPFGLLLDRDQPVAFAFNGRRQEAWAGDTIASALIADGRWVIARSARDHRPRAIFSMSGRDGQGLVRIDGVPNLPAETTPVYEALSAHPQNVTGPLDADLGAVLGSVGRLLPGRKPPAALAPLRDTLSRSLGGLGKVPARPPQEPYETDADSTDIAVIGSGAAGLAAALAAAQADPKLSVTLIDDGPLPGGGLLWRRDDPAGKRNPETRAKLLAEAEKTPNLRLLQQTVCQTLEPDHRLTLTQGRRLIDLRARAVVVATGAVGQPAVFDNNDLPGVVHAGAVQRLMRLYGVRPGNRAVILTHNGDGYGCALDLLEAGVEVGAVIDLRHELPACQRLKAVLEHDIEVLPAHAVRAAEAYKQHLQQVGISHGGNPDQPTRIYRWLHCDLLCVAAGEVPEASLLHQLGQPPRFQSTHHTFTVDPATLPPGVFVAGRLAGARSTPVSVAQGTRAGRAAAAHLGHAPAGADPKLPAEPVGMEHHPLPLTPGPNGPAFVDLDQDLTLDELTTSLTASGGDPSVLARQAAAGRGPGQGRLSHLALLTLAAERGAENLDGTPLPGPSGPAGGLAIGHLAAVGAETPPLSPLHRRHIDLGATLRPLGDTPRPAFYDAESAAEAAITREAQAVRTRVGIIDLSPAALLRLEGAEAGLFLDRALASPHADQKPGQARPALACAERGGLLAQGMALRLAEDAYYLSLDSERPTHVVDHLLRLAALWQLDVRLEDRSGADSALVLAGPEARKVLARLCPDTDLTLRRFPRLSGQRLDLQGAEGTIDTLVLRSGFAGEDAFLLHPPTQATGDLWDHLLESGGPEGIQPFGEGARDRLRIEAGEPRIGQDSDALCGPREAGLDALVGWDKPFFVGQAALAALAEHPQRRLARFRLDRPAAPPPKPAKDGETPTQPEAPPLILPRENQLVLKEGRIAGRVTSIARLETPEHGLGLALVEADLATPGSNLTIQGDAGLSLTAIVIDPA
ncbi:2Fe-2S iron-sulfur cluster-binding protein [Roseospirillum parvum]|uniref:Sarcosine oxidase subunit alpha n=1 Tax=Roseospirillum parvum TaxID=83401 RepID=A0A1G7WG15_9PROT|nr:2Fe-2S iron-sulfur cluster-binding protein [Roseospirillum parvum]SDG70882.1 sarcosine oxidase subunit alpha [Roseospirillum parvum]